MKVFVDFHHVDLYYSLHCLFEKRLGWELYRPTGLEWAETDNWTLHKFHNEPSYANFMLDHGGVLAHDWIPGWNYQEDEIYYLFDPTHEFFHKAVTLETFKKMNFDIIISSFEGHDYILESLRDAYHPEAKMIAHIGNFQQKTHLPNVIYSAPYEEESKNAVLVHQELDMNYFSKTSLPKETSIHSVVSFLPYRETYQAYKEALADIPMKAFGGKTPDGGLFGCKGVSQKMQEATIGWHLKPLGGLGHTSMGWFSIGRGVVTNLSQHRLNGSEALKFFEPGVTCIDIESYTVHEGERILRRYLKPENATKLGANANQRFQEMINYDEEEQAVRQFLSRIL